LRKTGAILYNLHNSPLTITLLDLIFSVNDLEVIQIMRNAVKKRQYFFLPVVWFMKLIAMMASEEAKKNNELVNKAIEEGNLDKITEYFQQAWTDGPHRTPADVDSTVREKVRVMTIENLRNWNWESVEYRLAPLAVGGLSEIKVPTLVILGGNPVYTAPADLDWVSAQRKAKTVVRLGPYEDETFPYCDWHLPAAHPLESWSDIRAHDGTVTILQPLIGPLYSGRSGHEVLAGLLGQPTPGHDIVQACRPDALFISNGPGDPKRATATIRCVQDFIGEVPVFGICFGNQITGLALGADTYKLKFGHRGANHPVKDLKSGRVFITAPVQTIPDAIPISRFGAVICYDGVDYGSPVIRFNAASARHCAQIMRTSRWERNTLAAEATRKGSAPMSIRREAPLAASFLEIGA
jgi:anthranilate/para-aminobenzoate synthase component II